MIFIKSSSFFAFSFSQSIAHLSDDDDDDDDSMFPILTVWGKSNWWGTVTAIESKPAPFLLSWLTGWMDGWMDGVGRKWIHITPRAGGV